MTNPVLETATDMEIENRVIVRMFDLYEGAIHFVKMPQFSAVDYLAIDNHGVAQWLLEIKSRKQTQAEVRRFGGLILKQRKAEELTQLSTLLNLRTYCVFAFVNGYGSLYSAETSSFTGKEPVLTGRRDRDLACDEEPVILLNWPDDANPDLKVVIQ